MTESQPRPRNAEARMAAAREAVRADAFRLARDSGSQIITRPMFSDRSEPTVRDVEPLAGARAARDLEHAACGTRPRLHPPGPRSRAMTGTRSATPSAWPPAATPTSRERRLQTAAYTYAAGRPDTEAPWRPRSFTWTCRSCDQHITDHGLIQGPADDELGHAGDCPRHAAAIAAWDAEAARWDAEWEAGQ